MGEQARFGKPDHRESDDYGFFAGSVRTNPAANPFTPTAAFEVGSAPAPAPTPQRPSGLGAGWKIGIAVAVAVVLIVLVMVGRFGWQQFLADPVLPDTLAGAPRLTNSLVEAQLESVAGAVRDELTAGSTARVALYSDGLGTGYILFVLRGGSRPGSEEDDATAGWTETEVAGATCWTSPAADAGFRATMCMRGFWRRAVLVMGISAAAPLDVAAVAQATNEAWDAQ